MFHAERQSVSAKSVYERVGSLFHTWPPVAVTSRQSDESGSALVFPFNIVAAHAATRAHSTNEPSDPVGAEPLSDLDARYAYRRDLTETRCTVARTT